LNIDRNSTD